MKKLLDLLATHGGVIVCSSSLSPQQIIIANACERMYVDENGIGFVYMEEYAQSHANQDGWQDSDTVDFAIWAAAQLVNRNKLINPRLLQEFKDKYKPLPPKPQI